MNASIDAGVRQTYHLCIGLIMKRLAATLRVRTISAPSCIYAQTTEHVAIPASAFDGRSVSYISYCAAVFIRDRAFAPVYLADHGVSGRDLSAEIGG